MGGPDGTTGAVRPPPRLLMPLWVDSTPPTWARVRTWLPRSSSTASNRGRSEQLDLAGLVLDLEQACCDQGCVAAHLVTAVGLGEIHRPIGALEST